MSGIVTCFVPCDRSIIIPIRIEVLSAEAFLMIVPHDSLLLLLIYLCHHIFLLFLDFLILFDLEDFAHLHFLLLELLE